MGTFIADLNSFAGLLSILLLFASAIIAGKSMAKSKISEDTSNAQQSAIAALKAELDTLRGRIDDIKIENLRLEQTIETICAALKTRGMYISISGEMVSIADRNGNSTTTRIHDK